MPGPTQTVLQTGLGGAIGCDFRTAQNQLIFVEYDTGKLSALTVAPATPAYTVLGTGFTTPEDVKLSVDGVHAYVTERTGNLVRVALSGGAATVVASGMTAPQQLFLDEAHNAAYVVEYAAAGDLLHINLTSGVKTVVASGLNNPVGVVLSADLQYAYVSEQTTGPDLGRISQIKISSAARTTIAKGLTAPFFLTWADAAQDSLIVPQRDPSNSIITVNVTSGVTNAIVTGVPFRPSSVAVPYSGEILVCSDSEIEAVSYVSFSTGPLLMGIGLIPATDVNALTGLATTPAGSPYQVTNAPFGGLLPIMVNYQSADTAGAAFYQVWVDGLKGVGFLQTDSWTVYFWNGVTNVLITVPAQMVGSSVGCYPVHPVSQLFNYQPPSLGYELDSTRLSNGLHTIQLQFLDSGGNELTPNLVSAPLTILVNNQSCVATLSPPAPGADSCGVIHYGVPTTTVTLSYTATHPANFAFYSFALVRGVTPVNPLLPPLPSGAPVPATLPIKATVAQLMAPPPPAPPPPPCTVAGFAAEVYVAATMTNGFTRQSQYDAEALMGFVLTP
jgi:hypothetical protein